MNKDNKKVIIGVVAKHKKTDEPRTYSLIRDEIRQAVIANSAIAIGILSVHDDIQYENIESGKKEWKEVITDVNKENIIAQINLCDGIIIQGGVTNEAFETFIAKYCYDNDIPCLGTCAGQNCIAYALDGSIYKIPNPEKHNKSYDYVHKINIDKSSKFYDIIGKECMMVNSIHQNSIKDCPKLSKVAFCEDGYADVIESSEKKFYMGLRFHPESLYKT
ncbi:MAG: gamma-glutamyl-gamma-aminobutyrate hydrolase family protein, partial [Bacilli bacterium]|nr:gamma-glutamyl-gamma-aminobutyrate hydrolase family protein [Bacilli bacterium]